MFYISQQITAIFGKTAEEREMYPLTSHMHTVASTHAYSNLHDYIAQAKLKGIRLFAIAVMARIWRMRRTTGIL